MEFKTDLTYKMQLVKKTCYIANLTYLLAHIFYLILFIVARINDLIYLNIAAIVLYLAFFLIIKKEKYYYYALACGNTFFAVVFYSTRMVGFGSGFYLYLIGLCVVSFFTTYFSKARNLKGSMVWVALSMSIYIVLYILDIRFPTKYRIEGWLEMTLFMFHCVAAFAMVASYMIIFLRYAFSLEKKIMNESRIDELTQISNRYGLYDFFDEEKNKANKVLALFDIDNFKKINDTYGHVAGDNVLKRVAKIANESLQGAFICRYGGEEFVVVLEDDGQGSSFNALEEFRKNIEKEPFEFEGNTVSLTITIGAEHYSEGVSLEKWVELADKRMYSGKNTGKNKTVF